MEEFEEIKEDIKEENIEEQKETEDNNILNETKNKKLTPYEKFEKFKDTASGIVKNVAKFALLGGLILAPVAAAISGIVILSNHPTGNITSPVLHVAFGIGSAFINSIGIKKFYEDDHDYFDEFGG